MASGIFQRINNLFLSKSDAPVESKEGSLQMLKLAIAEMELSISKSLETLTRAEANQKSHIEQANQYKKEAEDWLNKATSALKTGDDEVGKRAFEKKFICDKQYERYKGLADNANSTILQLKTQLNGMNAKLAEVKAEESYLSAKNATENTQIEASEHIEKLNQVPLEEFDVFENKSIEVATVSEEKEKIELQREPIINKIEVQKFVLSEFEALKKKFKEEEEAQLLLDKEKQKQLIKEHFGTESNKSVDNKKSLVDSFLNENVSKTEDKKQKEIDDFFKKN